MNPKRDTEFTHPGTGDILVVSEDDSGNIVKVSHKQSGKEITPVSFAPGFAHTFNQGKVIHISPGAMIVTHFNPICVIKNIGGTMVKYCYPPA